MKSYQEMVTEYKKRQKDTLIDAISTGLTYADNIAVDSGALEQAGMLNDVASPLCSALPFVIIAFAEGSKVILGRKHAKTGAKDAARRMLKTGTAIGVGALVSSVAGIWAAIPASMGSRMVFDHYKSSALTNMRIRSRITRLHEMNQLIREQGQQQKQGENEAVSNENPLEAIGIVQ